MNKLESSSINSNKTDANNVHRRDDGFMNSLLVTIGA